MAYYFFDNITQLKEYVGGGANLSVSLSSLEPALHAALHNHLIIHLSAEQWEELVTAYDTGSYPGSLSAQQKALMEYIRRPLALLALYEYSQIASIQLGEQGIFRMENENMRSAFKYQENSYRDWMLHQGYEAIEQMLAYLETNRATFTTWAASTGRSRYRGVLLHTAQQFRNLYSRYISRYTYESLRSLIEDVENFVLRKLIGDDQYEALLALTSPSALESTFLKLCRTAVANFTVEEAIRRHLIAIDGNKIIQSERLEPQSYEKTSNPGGALISYSVKVHGEWGNRHLSYLKKFLDTNEDEFPLYAAYAEELAAAEAAAAEETSDLPERCPSCLLYSCSCSSTESTAVVGF